MLSVGPTAGDMINAQHTSSRITLHTVGRRWCESERLVGGRWFSALEASDGVSKLLRNMFEW